MIETNKKKMNDDDDVCVYPYHHEGVFNEIFLPTAEI